MDHIFETLRVSTDNDARKAASAQLRSIQEGQPDQFLDYTFQCVSSATFPTDLRFFAATAVLQFVDESWHNAVSKEAQLAHTQRYVSFALSEQMPSPLLARKVATIIAVMARRGSGRAQPGELPPLLHLAASAYTDCLLQRCVVDGALVSGSAARLLPQLLLLVHILIKEAQAKRVGNAFELLCKGMVAPLSAVFAALAPFSPLELYEPHLFLFKAALRVFGCGVFVPSFYRFLLDATWTLADGLGATGEGPAEHAKRTRLIDYGVKIQERMVNYFPAQLHELGADFFLSPNRSLLSLVDAVVSAGVAAAPGQESPPVLSEKTVCRAMRLVTFLIAAEDGDEFLSRCIGAFSQTDIMARVIRSVIVGYLPDDVSAAARRKWRSDPEKVAADLDVDLDDDSPTSCAEQLFLSLTGSTAAAPAALPVAWAIVNELLGAGSEREVTAALHAIGIGYYTMASGTSQDSYTAFLQGKLLPILADACDATATATATSLFVLRRVVWLIGMWCESATDPALRRQVHAGFDAVVRRYGMNIVVLLTALRATENFFTDSSFTLEELPADSVPVTLGAVQHVLTHLTAPVTVRQVSCLINSMVGKGAVGANGDYLLSVFAPALVSFVARCEESFAAAAAGSGAAGFAAATAVQEGDDWGMDDGDDEGGEVSINMSVLPLMLEAITSIVRVCACDLAVWHLFRPVVLACTEPGRAITPWAEDAAWELLLAMARATTFSRLVSADDAAAMRAVVGEALAWCRANSGRDFETLHVAVRAASALVLLAAEGRGQHPADATAEVLVPAADVAVYLGILAETQVEELCSCCLALLLAAVRTDPAAAAGQAVVEGCARLLASSADIQSEAYAIPAAALVSLVMRCDDSQVLLRGFAGLATGPAGGALIENLVLVLDVCANRLMERCVCWLLSQVAAVCSQNNAPLPPDVAAMIARAAESAFAAPTVPSPGVADDVGSDGEEDRPRDELLLEMLGDEDVAATEPHFARVTRFYGGLVEHF